VSDPVADFFRGRALAARLYGGIVRVLATLPGHEVRVQTSQIGFYANGHPFASVWMPKSYLRRGAPLVLTVMARRRLPSSRWKQVVQPRPGRFTHHLELWAVEDIDDDVVRWLWTALSDVAPGSATERS
jgi:hypothetical protein